MKQPFYMTVGGRLRRHRHSLVIERTDPETPDGPPLRLPVPVEQVEAIYAFREIDLNSKLVGLLARHGVLLHFFDYYGHYTATLYPRAAQISGRVHVLQAAHYLRPRRRLRLARALARAALANMRRVLRYYRNRLPEDAQTPLDEAARLLREHRDRLSEAADVGEIFGLEGAARAAYYQAWNALPGLGDGPFRFTRRTRRPPQDPLNALISFGNTLCYALVLQKIYQTALDPAIAYLHEPGDRRFSLALDLSELFKPLLVDRTILTMVRSGRIRERHFKPHNGGVYLDETGRRRFLEHWDRRLQRTFFHKPLKRRVRYDELPLMACHELLRHLNDPKNHPFKGFHMKW